MIPFSLYNFQIRTQILDFKLIIMIIIKNSCKSNIKISFFTFFRVMSIYNMSSSDNTKVLNQIFPVDFGSFQSFYKESMKIGTLSTGDWKNEEDKIL